MKKLLFLVLFLASFCGVSKAQSYYPYENCSLTNNQGAVIPNAQVYFLNQPADIPALLPLATVYGNATGSGGQITNPVTTNSNGLCTAYLNIGQYTVCYVSPRITTYCVPDQVITAPSDGPVIQNNSPLSVTDPSIGASCDGITDDSPVFNGTLYNYLLNTYTNTGIPPRTILIPSTCLLKSGWNLTNLFATTTGGIHIIGLSGIYAGTSNILCEFATSNTNGNNCADMTGSTGITMSGINIKGGTGISNTPNVVLLAGRDTGDNGFSGNFDFTDVNLSGYGSHLYYSHGGEVVHFYGGVYLQTYSSGVTEDVIRISQGNTEGIISSFTTVLSIAVSMTDDDFYDTHYSCQYVSVGCIVFDTGASGAISDMEMSGYGSLNTGSPATGNPIPFITDLGQAGGYIRNLHFHFHRVENDSNTAQLINFDANIFRLTVDNTTWSGGHSPSVPAVQFNHVGDGTVIDFQPGDSYVYFANPYVSCTHAANGVDIYLPSIVGGAPATVSCLGAVLHEPGPSLNAGCVRMGLPDNSSNCPTLNASTDTGSMGARLGIPSSTVNEPSGASDSEWADVALFPVTVTATSPGSTYNLLSTFEIHGAPIPYTGITNTSTASESIDGGTLALLNTNTCLIIGGATLGYSSATGCQARLIFEDGQTNPSPTIRGWLINEAAQTFTDNGTAGSGTVTNEYVNSFLTPTIAASNTSVTHTNEYDMVFTAPVQGTNMTITNSYALGLSGALNMIGSNSPIMLNGSAGTTGQVMTSAGAGATDTWATPSITPTTADAPADTACALAGDTTALSTALTGVSSSASQLTYTMASVPNLFYAGQIVSAQGNTTTAYNLAPLTIASTTATTVLINNSSNPGAGTAGGTMSLYCGNQSNDAISAHPYTFANGYAMGANYFATGNPSVDFTGFFSTGSSTGAPNLSISLVKLNTAIWSASSAFEEQNSVSGKGGTLTWRLSGAGASLVNAELVAHAWNTNSADSVWTNSVLGPYPINTSAQTVAPQLYWAATGVVTATYVSGGSFTGTGTCTLGAFNNSSTATGTIAVSSGTPGAITITARGQSATAAPTSVAQINSCTGTGAWTSGAITITSTLGGVAGNWAVLRSFVTRTY